MLAQTGRDEDPAQPIDGALLRGSDEDPDQLPDLGIELRERTDPLRERRPLAGRVCLQAGIEDVGRDEELVRALRRKDFAEARGQARAPLGVDRVLIDTGERQLPLSIRQTGIRSTSCHFYPLAPRSLRDGLRAVKLAPA